jgi:aryl-alcohol dehydrogenase-like predicted oxidoreductase
MKYRLFGTTGIKISEIALGTMHFKWIISENESMSLLDFYVSSGGNFIDTSDMYTQWAEGLKGGEAEKIIGRWLKLRKNRDKIFLTTKVRARMWEGPDGEGLSKAHIIKACDKSLRRLQTDYIDVYMSHWPDPETPLEETTQAYKELQQQGKIRFIGLSNYSGMQLKDALETADKLNCKYSCIEPYYNLLQRSSFENVILPLVQTHKLAVTPYSPLAGGFLSGHYNTKNWPTTPRAKFVEDKLTSKNSTLLACLKKVAKKYKKTISQISLAWLLHHDWITAPIIGAETIAQLDDNLLSSDVLLSQEDVQRIDKITKDN